MTDHIEVTATWGATDSGAAGFLMSGGDSRFFRNLYLGTTRADVHTFIASMNRHRERAGQVPFRVVAIEGGPPEEVSPLEAEVAAREVERLAGIRIAE